MNTMLQIMIKSFTYAHKIFITSKTDEPLQNYKLIQSLFTTDKTTVINNAEPNFFFSTSP